MMLISELSVHPQNLEIFGKDEKNVERLVLSIKEHGVLTPLIVTPGGLIISGKCRYFAALKVGLTELPVEIRVYRDELDEIDAIINTNEQRELSKEQKVRVGRKKEWMVKERAKARMLAGVKIEVEGDPVDLSPQGISPKSRDIIAKMVGFGTGKRYDQADDVVAVIDTLPEDKAQVLRALLEKSTETAYRIVKEKLVDRLIPEIIVKLQNEDVAAIRIYRKIKQAETAEELRKTLEVKEPEDRINPEWEELEKKSGGRACAYDPTSVIDEVVLCPCGCGCGFYRVFQTENDRWYLKDELSKLKEMRENAE